MGDGRKAGRSRSSRGPAMLPTLPRLILFALLLGCFTISSSLPGREKPAGGDKSPGYAGLTVHEWGTFTSIAGARGQAAEWSPQTGSTDLPAFVEHFRTPEFKLGLRGTVRMETPVLYFYDSREENVSVEVSFAKGLITEWYPRASRVEPVVNPAAPNPAAWSLFHGGTDGSIAWDAVTVSPTLRAEFPREGSFVGAQHAAPQLETQRALSESHYYAARMTSATPLRVKTPSGEQHEKFLFYRGVSNFQIPL